MKIVALTFIQLISFVTYAQIQFEHEYDPSSTVVHSSYCQSCEKIVHYKLEDQILYIYTDQHVEYKQVDLSAFGAGSISGVTDLLFDKDNGIEFLYQGGNFTRVIDESGEVLMEFESPGTPPYAWVIFAPNGNKLYLYYKDSNDQYVTRFYSLPSSSSTGGRVLGSGYNSSMTSAWPNPSSEVINLPYQLSPGKRATLHIIKENGQHVKSMHVDGSLDHVKLPVNGYSPGVYLYEYNGIVGKFVVQ